MDEAFWANVVKRWSEASDNVLKLKEELTRLQSEVRSSTLLWNFFVLITTSSAFYIVTQRTRRRDTVLHNFQRAILLEMFMRRRYQTAVVKILQTSSWTRRLASVELKKSTAGYNKRYEADILATLVRLLNLFIACHICGKDQDFKFGKRGPLGKPARVDKDTEGSRRAAVHPG